MKLHFKIILLLMPLFLSGCLETVATQEGAALETAEALAYKEENRLIDEFSSKWPIYRTVE